MSDDSSYRYKHQLTIIKQEQEKSKKAAKDSFNGCEELRSVWGCECAKCYNRFDCRDKHDRYYCEKFENSSDHDKQVIEEFVSKLRKKAKILTDTESKDKYCVYAVSIDAIEKEQK